jgi:phosphonate ABC transporter permease subunit PhnE
MDKKPSFKRSLVIGFTVVIAILVLAYGFQVTEVNFEETRSETRLTQLSRIIRALAHPEILEYERDEVFVEAPIYLPCPEAEPSLPEVDTSGPYITLEPYCADAGEPIVVSGSNLLPNSRGPINFIPPSGASLTIGDFIVDSEGNFEEEVELPNRQPVADAQIIRAIGRTNVGAPHFSPVAKATWNKIIETVFLALLATVFGTMIAIPLSFLSARNLMSDVKSPVASVALTLTGWPIGVALSLQAVRLVAQISEQLAANMLLTAAGLVISPVLAYFIARWAIPPEELNKPPAATRIIRIIALILAALLFILATLLLAQLMYVAGNALDKALGPFGFIGYFIAQAGEILRIITPGFAALAGAAVVGGALGNFGMVLTDRIPYSSLRYMNIIFSAVAGAIIFAIIGAGLNWLYQINDPFKTLWLPMVVGALVGGVLSLRYGPKDLVPIGSVIYMIMRTILNAVRSIEPLIYVIVFVVWVGIGPFAGALALALHTIAALAKLYSEQVESISSGPLEAVTATGANRLQTIIYAVVPQIIPPYISFTMYRWDINVRMSTIIGFAGGGGIGFLLQQNIRLLDYRAAAVQMLAIAIVVATMDYTSALIRERFV